MFCIAICTYNRANILQLTLPELKKYRDNDMELLLIDNGSTDGTRKVFEEMNFSNARYIFESKIGLSYARNRAIKESKCNWIFYLDDDAKVLVNTISIAKELTSKYSDYGMIGGVYTPWYIDEKPKWLSDKFGSFIPNFNEFKQITSFSDSLPAGGILLFNKNKMEDLVPFQSYLGMKGKKLGYGEETELVVRALKNSIKVGLEPNWKILHLVAAYKFKLRWQIQSEFHNRRATYKILNLSIIPDIIYFFRGNLVTILKRLPMLIFRKDYYVNTFILETLRPSIWLLGSIIGKAERVFK